MSTRFKSSYLYISRLAYKEMNSLQKKLYTQLIIIYPISHTTGMVFQPPVVHNNNRQHPHHHQQQPHSAGAMVYSQMQAQQPHMRPQHNQPQQQQAMGGPQHQQRGLTLAQLQQVKRDNYG